MHVRRPCVAWPAWLLSEVSHGQLELHCGGEPGRWSGADACRAARSQQSVLASWTHCPLTHFPQTLPSARAVSGQPGRARRRQRARTRALASLAKLQTSLWLCPAVWVVLTHCPFWHALTFVHCLGRGSVAKVMTSFRTFREIALRMSPVRSGEAEVARRLVTTSLVSRRSRERGCHFGEGCGLLITAVRLASPVWSSISWQHRHRSTVHTISTYTVCTPLVPLL